MNDRRLLAIEVQITPGDTMCDRTTLVLLRELDSRFEIDQRVRELRSRIATGGATDISFREEFGLMLRRAVFDQAIVDGFGFRRLIHEFVEMRHVDEERALFFLGRFRFGSRIELECPAAIVHRSAAGLRLLAGLLVRLLDLAHFTKTCAIGIQLGEARANWRKTHRFVFLRLLQREFQLIDDDRMRVFVHSIARVRDT